MTYIDIDATLEKFESYTDRFYDLSRQIYQVTFAAKNFKLRGTAGRPSNIKESAPEELMIDPTVQGQQRTRKTKKGTKTSKKR